MLGGPIVQPGLDGLTRAGRKLSGPRHVRFVIVIVYLENEKDPSIETRVTCLMRVTPYRNHVHNKLPC